MGGWFFGITLFFVAAVQIAEAADGLRVENQFVASQIARRLGKAGYAGPAVIGRVEEGMIQLMCDDSSQCTPVHQAEWCLRNGRNKCPHRIAIHLNVRQYAPA